MCLIYCKYKYRYILGVNYNISCYTYFKYFLRFLNLRRIWMACAENSLHLIRFHHRRENNVTTHQIWYIKMRKISNGTYTSLTRVSVWSISISQRAFFPMPFRNVVKSFFGYWPFVTDPLPRPPQATAPPRPIDFLNPRPGPDPIRPPLRDIPGSSPSHRMSSGEI